MTRTQLEQRYEENGCRDYQLKNLEQLKAIHGIDVNEISGYKGLSAENKSLFDETVIRFFNAFGLDNRKELFPKSVNHVREVRYSNADNYEVGVEIFLINSKGTVTRRRLHRYVFEKDAQFADCEKTYSDYLRFELRGEWFHFTENHQWY